jgi:hypothetical protein
VLDDMKKETARQMGAVFSVAPAEGAVTATGHQNRLKLGAQVRRAARRGDSR